MNIGSILASVSYNYGESAATASTNGSSASTSSGDLNNMTIAQIRDMTDKMALDGKLTDSQQMALIGDGLQDLNAADPSYQPSTNGIGYSRADTGTYNVTSMMEGAATFASSVGNSQMAAIYQSIASALGEYENSSSMTGMNTTA